MSKSIARRGVCACSLACASILTTFPPVARAAAFTWDGRGQTLDVSEGANWVGNVPPPLTGDGADVTFTDVGNNLASTTPNVNTNVGFRSLTFAGGTTFHINTAQDRGLSLASGLTQNSNADQEFALPIFLDADQVFAFNASGAVRSTGAKDTINTQGHALTIFTSASSTVQAKLASRIIGAGGLIVAATNQSTVTLGGASTFTGGTLVRDGTLVLANGSLVGDVSLPSARFQVGDGGRLGPATGTGTGTLSIGVATAAQAAIGSGALADGGVINVATTTLGNLSGPQSPTAFNGGQGSFTQTGGTLTTGSLTIESPDAYPFIGDYALKGGTLRAGSEQIGGNSSFTQSGGTHVVTGFVNIDSGTSADVTTSYSIAGPVGSSTFSATTVVVGSGSSASFTVAGGAATVTSADGATGGILVATEPTSFATVTLSGGTLAARAIVGGRGNSTLRLNGGTLAAAVDSAAFVTNVRNAAIDVRGATIDTAGHDVTIAQAINHYASDSATDGGLTKVGLGTLRLAGNNTYTGGTTVGAGRLLVDTPGGGSGTGAGTVNVNNGGTLGGTGRVGGIVFVNGGGTLSPGDDGVGTLTAGLNLGLSSGGTLRFELAGTGAGQSDRLVVSNLVSLAGDLAIDRLNGFDLPLAQTIVLLANSGTLTTFGAFANAPAGIYIDPDDGRRYLVNYFASAGDGTNGNDVSITRIAVPEPTTLVAAIAGLALVARRRRR